MQQSQEHDPSQTSHLIEVDRICRKFEEAWKAGGRPGVRDYLAEGHDEIRAALLRELLLMDVEYRRRDGQRVTAATYCDQFPADVEVIQAVLKQSLQATGRSPCTPSHAPPTAGRRPASGAPANAAGEAARLRLDVVAGPSQGRHFVFEGHDSFIVGRAKCAHFRPPRHDPYFSRIHLMIEVNPPCCRLFDMGSTNGTRVNGKQVECIDLQDGDLIQGGDTVLEVSLQGDWGGASPTVTLPGPAATAGPPPLPHRRPSPKHPPSPEPSAEFDFAQGVRPASDPTEAEASLESSKIAGYQLQRELGCGGMGTVYLAVRCADRSSVAIKVVRPVVAGSAKKLALFLREVRILEQLRHPNIVAFYDMGQTGGLLYFVMEYVSGTNSKQLVEQQGPLPIATAVDLVCQTLGALHHAHHRGFVHRDVKPANLLVTRPSPYPLPVSEKTAEEVVWARVPTCKLADFGLARAYHQSTLSGLTMLGDIGGTVPFMPPEQITDYRNVQPPADLYSTAASLYWMLTAQHVFDFGNEPSHQRVARILSDTPVPIRRRRPEIPQSLARVIHRALSKDPAERYRDALALQTALLPFRGSASP